MQELERQSGGGRGNILEQARYRYLFLDQKYPCASYSCRVCFKVATIVVFGYQSMQVNFSQGFCCILEDCYTLVSMNPVSFPSKIGVQTYTFSNLLATYTLSVKVQVCGMSLTSVALFCQFCFI